MNKKFKNNHMDTCIAGIDLDADIDTDIANIKRYINSKFISNITTQVRKHNLEYDVSKFCDSFVNKPTESFPTKKDDVIDMTQFLHPSPNDETQLEDKSKVDNGKKPISRYKLTDDIKTNNMTDYIDVITKIAFQKNWRNLNEIHKIIKLKEYVEKLPIEKMERKKELLNILIAMVKKKTLKNKCIDYNITDCVISNIDIIMIENQDFTLQT